MGTRARTAAVRSWTAEEEGGVRETKEAEDDNPAKNEGKDDKEDK